MAPYRIVFMGTPDFAVPALARLVARRELAEVVAVVTQPDRPAGRGRHITASPVKRFATAHHIAVLQPTRLKTEEYGATLAAYAADVFIVAAYGRILPQAVLDVPRLGCINLHASILPRLRGASPIAHAIWHGDAQAGVSLMHMEAGLDSGPVYCMRTLPIDAAATCGSLTDDLAELGADLLLESLPGILDQSCRAEPQDAAHATYAPRLDKAHGRLDWRGEAAMLARQVRAFDPWPGTHAFVANPKGPARRVAILRAHAYADQGATSHAPGAILAAGAKGIVVACGRGALRLEQVKPEGRKALAAGAWVAGRSITAQDHFEVC